eukprot:scaffold7391_cov198-Prasinococcus_capsulatus_cf.AAC.3
MFYPCGASASVSVQMRRLRALPLDRASTQSSRGWPMLSPLNRCDPPAAHSADGPPQAEGAGGPSEGEPRAGIGSRESVWVSVRLPVAPLILYASSAPSPRQGWGSASARWRKGRDYNGGKNVDWPLRLTCRSGRWLEPSRSDESSAGSILQTALGPRDPLSPRRHGRHRRKPPLVLAGAPAKGLRGQHSLDTAVRRRPVTGERRGLSERTGPSCQRDGPAEEPGSRDEVLRSSIWPSKETVRRRRPLSMPHSSAPLEARSGNSIVVSIGKSGFACVVRPLRSRAPPPRLLLETVTSQADKMPAACIYFPA